MSIKLCGRNCRYANRKYLFSKSRYIHPLRQYTSSVSHDSDVTTKQNKTTNKISNKMTSFISHSISSLESYLINQTNLRPDSIDDLPIDRANYIPAQLKSYNSPFREFIDISNPQDIEYLLSIDRSSWYNVTPQIHSFMEFNCDYNLPLLLNHYARSLPEVQKVINRKDRVSLSLTSLKKMISILVNLQWFNNASYILYRMDLPFNELVNVLNEILEEELIFQNSDWMRYFFLVHLNKHYEAINKNILANVDFLSFSGSMKTFKALQFMWNKQYLSMDELKEDLSFFYEATGKSDHILLMYHFKSIELIKSTQIDNLELQIHELKKNISTLSSIFTKKIHGGAVSLFIGEMSSATNDELQKFKGKELFERIEKRKISILNYLLIRKKIEIKDMDVVVVSRFNLNFETIMLLWEYNLQKRNNRILNTIYYKFFVENIIKSLISCNYKSVPTGKSIPTFKKKNLLHEIFKVEYQNISSTRKISILINQFKIYLRNNSVVSRDRVGGFLSLTNNTMEYSYVMKRVMYSIFGPNSEFSYKEILKSLEVIASFSPTTLNKQYLFGVVNHIIFRNYNDEGFFSFKSPNDRFFKSIEFIELLDSMDPLAVTYYSNLYPSIIKFFRDYVSSDPRSMDDILAEEYTLKFIKLLNDSFNYISSNPKNLSILNPKNYSSKIYLIKQGLLQHLASELRHLPNKFIIRLLKFRSDYLCKNNQDWIFKFNQSVFVYGIFLEVFFRRSRRGNDFSFSDLPTSAFKLKIEEEMDKLAMDPDVWECLEFVAGFDWSAEISSSLLADSTKPDNLGEGIAFVLSELKRMDGVDYFEREDFVNKFKPNKKVDGSGHIHRITDSLLDSISDSTHDDIDQAYLNNMEDSTKSFLSKRLASNELFEVDEIYENLRNFKDMTKINDIKGIGEDHENAFHSIPDKFLNYNDDMNSHRNNKGKFKKRYSIQTKERMIRLYSPIRLKGLMIQSLIKQNPFVVDFLINRLFTEYDSRIPVSLIHSIMIGVIKSEGKLKFTEKIDLIKILDVLASTIYKGASSRANSYLFMQYVRFKEFRTMLVDLVIQESKRSNSGSLKTLNWAMNKITNSSNLKNYKEDLNRWTNELNNMKERQIGFWNPLNELGRWDD
ncbi:uncharacterized protein C5L36_0E01740 [Pichia kudriavzevii]|uniref:Uncharacterized protein n=2 Tax=Pichia kudriavzevii TaxID=4909 RepID=A0A2U9RAD5_PICKU|nr:uncharacterized protein C5L36_0E01740 [Pichia kudriavzevii]AWU78111.1 hypothetical protein C5L36_0E01740 [Pichia kudriavzevii]